MKQLKITNSLTNRESSSVEKYFTEVSKEPLLTPEEEVTLAKKIKEGDQSSLNKLVTANLRFVISVAKQYQYGKVPFIDLINEGNLGLIKAAKMFDESRGFKFISYAVWWIRQSIIKALEDHSRIVRIPSNKAHNLLQISKATSTMQQQLERDPTNEELSDFLEISIKDLDNIQNASIKQLSLDCPFEENDSNCLLDIIKNPNAEPADQVMDKTNSLSIEMKRLLSVLTFQESEIIRRLFGIGVGFTCTLQDIAEELGLSKERVRQIKNISLKKLREEANLQLLLPYFE
jgi:RNA polymerase primary sigma factor